MQAHLELDIADVDRLIREGLARERPDVEVVGYSVYTWRRTLLIVREDDEGRRYVHFNSLKHQVSEERRLL